jgi:hypothetical protein
LFTLGELFFNIEYVVVCIVVADKIGKRKLSSIRERARCQQEEALDQMEK